MLEDLVRKQGGKFGVLTYLKEISHDLPIPPYVVKEHGRPVDYLSSELEQLKPPYIVRSSHPQELWGFAGLFRSVPGTRSSDEIKKAVSEIEQAAKSEKVQLYAQQRGVKLEEGIHVGIQEQRDAIYNGYLLRHPNYPALIIADISEGKGGTRSNWLFYYREDARAFVRDASEWKYDIDEAGLPREDILEAIDCFRIAEHALEGTDLLGGYALQMEFGLKPVSVYQVRPFKRKETADFPMPKADSGQSIWRPNICFGVTGEDGILLPAVRGFSIDLFTSSVFREIKEMGVSDDEIELIHGASNLNMMAMLDEEYFPLRQGYKREAGRILEGYRQRADGKYGSGYCFTTQRFDRDEPLADMAIPHCMVFVDTKSPNFLTHTIFRPLQNVEVSVLNMSEDYEDIHKKVKTGDMLRIISNGKKAVILKE